VLLLVAPTGTGSITAYHVASWKSVDCLVGPVDASVTHLSSAGTGPAERGEIYHRFVASMDRVEGFSVLELLSKTADVAPYQCRSLLRVSTEAISRGVGGAVNFMTADLEGGGCRVAVATASGHVTIFHILLQQGRTADPAATCMADASPLGCGITARAVGAVLARGGVQALHYFPWGESALVEAALAKGAASKLPISLLAVVAGGKLKFIPSYYTKATS
jgi:hypothetical protein